MPIRIIMASLLVLTLSFAAGAQSRFDMVVKKKGGPDLLRESKTLRLTEEVSVQREPTPPHRTYSVQAGVLTSRDLVVVSNGEEVHYDLAERTPMVNLLYSDYPFYWHGQWGWQAEVGYGQLSQGAGAQQTKLHLIPSQISLSYRWRRDLAQRVSPFLSFGPANIAYVQRGTQSFNTSANRWASIGSAGLVVNMSRLFNLDSPVPVEGTLMYQRIFSRATVNGDLSGDIWSAGVGLSL